MGLILLGGAGPAAAECPLPAEGFVPDPDFTSRFVPPCVPEGRTRKLFGPRTSNAYFPLTPGLRVVLESDEEVAVVHVLDETRRVGGVLTRVVEELAYEKDGEARVLTERSFNYFAGCKANGAVYYFGEDVFNFRPDGSVDNEGAWLAGRNGARPGIIMPGTFTLGGGYYQEVAPEDSALDKGQVAAIHDTCEVGDFEFEHCVEIVDTSDCDPESEDAKLYAPGLGNVADEDLEITEFGFVDDEDED